MRTLALAVVMVVVAVVLPRALPGSPLAAGGDVAVPLPAAVEAELRRAYRLDRPLAEQLAYEVGRLLRADLGRSLATHRPVRAMIAERLPLTALLVGTAVLASAVLGGMLGTIAACRPRAATSRLVEPVIIGLGALPEALVAMLLIVVLGTRFPIFPAGGAGTPFLAAGGWSWRVVLDALWHAVLPILTLVIGLVPAFSLLARNALVPVLAAPFLLAARGKGLPPARVLWHAWRNALPPLLTLLGLRLAFAMTGAALVERLFAYPGVGSLLFEAVARRDYPVLQGVFLVFGAVMLAVTAVLDLVAVLLDPRLRGDRG
ncbi:MAG: ABC transporter permease [Armatimonadota bacterium]|nr:ABC transporter permease [Armatimonadota bacterium]MDR7457089.1 ABC transporter permease [Armatimonadota bacterium]MDR7497488.1 ABC transporter permease [Armatimonadota bacterium]MDR7512030.1 ABC transporter permease [Armatimonadota bacterium]